MFLFTTPAAAPVPSGAPQGNVVESIRRGAEQTGTDFGYLLGTAQRESSLNPVAKAPTSSATGLFQFIEQTWLGLVKSQGGKLGLSDLAASISARGDGGYAVSDPETKQAILKLRENPDLSSIMAGTLTHQNRESLAGTTGREPTSGELYMAHLLGPRGAADLIRSASQAPDRTAAADLPEAAAANRAIFFDRQGRARSAAEVYASLSAAPVTSAAVSSAAAQPAVPSTPTLPRTSGPALYGLFQTGDRKGPVSDAVAKLWRVNNATVDARQRPALAFFPREDGERDTTPAEEPAAAADVAVAEAPPAATAGASVPLPPP
ncbi:MAG: hypothetical protein JWR08_1570, partial [Enterovirga sp.]|nr:hypothetical protein [Enterovirga sp.]